VSDFSLSVASCLFAAIISTGGIDPGASSDFGSLLPATGLVIVCGAAFCFCFSPRVRLWDRHPGPGAKQLANAAVFRAAPPSAGLQALGDLVTKHMPAMELYDADVNSECLDDDYAAMELLYYTDAYEHLLAPHFIAKGVYHPKKLRQLCMDPGGKHRRLVFLWNARFMSVM